MFKRAKKGGGYLEQMYVQDIVIGLKRNGDIKVMKNRFGVPDANEMDVEILTDIFSKALAKGFLKNSMTLFEDDVVQELNKSILNCFQKMKGQT
jgi:purine-nucleoside phosphorylase